MGSIEICFLCYFEKKKMACTATPLTVTACGLLRRTNIVDRFTGTHFEKHSRRRHKFTLADTITTCTEEAGDAYYDYYDTPPGTTDAKSN